MPAHRICNKEILCDKGPLQVWRIKCQLNLTISFPPPEPHKDPRLNVPGKLPHRLHPHEQADGHELDGEGDPQQRDPHLPDLPHQRRLEQGRPDRPPQEPRLHVGEVQGGVHGDVQVQQRGDDAHDGRQQLVRPEPVRVQGGRVQRETHKQGSTSPPHTEGGEIFPGVKTIIIDNYVVQVHTLTALEYFREHKDSLTTDKYHKCQVDEATKILTCLEIFLPAVLCQDSVGQLLPA